MQPGLPEALKVWETVKALLTDLKTYGSPLELFITAIYIILS